MCVHSGRVSCSYPSATRGDATRRSYTLTLSRHSEDHFRSQVGDRDGDEKVNGHLNEVWEEVVLENCQAFEEVVDLRSGLWM